MKALTYFQRVTKLEALGASIISPEKDGEEIFYTCSQQVHSQICNKCVYLTLLKDLFMCVLIGYGADQIKKIENSTSFGALLSSWECVP